MLLNYLKDSEIVKSTVTVGELNNRLSNAKKEYIHLKIIDVNEWFEYEVLKAEITILCKSGHITYFLKISDEISPENPKPKYENSYKKLGYFINGDRIDWIRLNNTGSIEKGKFHKLKDVEFVAIPLGIEIDENINDLDALVIVTGDIKTFIEN